MCTEGASPVALGQVLVKISDLRSNLKKIITRHESGINHERKWEQLSQPRPSPKRRNSKPDKVSLLACGWVRFVVAALLFSHPELVWRVTPWKADPWGREE